MKSKLLSRRNIKFLVVISHNVLPHFGVLKVKEVYNIINIFFFFFLNLYINGQFDPMKNPNYLTLVIWNNSTPQRTWNGNCRRVNKLFEPVSFQFHFY